MALFTQAMERGQYTWGRRAKLVAGASIAIALAEGGSSNSLNDIAFLLDESLRALSRAYRDVSTLLGLQAVETTPVTYLGSLEIALKELIDDGGSSLSQVMKKALSQLSLLNVFKISSTLAGLLGRKEGLLGSSKHISIAIVLFSVEADLRYPLPQLGPLASLLGARLGVAKCGIMASYSQISAYISDLSRSVPWLSQTGPRRTRVAKGLNDVIAFQENVWRTNLNTVAPLEVLLEEDNAAEDVNDAVSHFRALHDESFRSQKQKRTRSLQGATQFLLDPLSVPLRVADNVSSPTSQASYLLSHGANISHDEAPTRLQLILGQRSADDISDDELFDDGELDGFMRHGDELKAHRAVLQQTCWDQPNIALPHTVKVPAKRGSERVDLKILARLLEAGSNEIVGESQLNREGAIDDAEILSSLD